MTAPSTRRSRRASGRTGAPRPHRTRWRSSIRVRPASACDRRPSGGRPRGARPRLIALPGRPRLADPAMPSLPRRRARAAVRAHRTAASRPAPLLGVIVVAFMLAFFPRATGSGCRPRATIGRLRQLERERPRRATPGDPVGFSRPGRAGRAQVLPLDSVWASSASPSSSRPADRPSPRADAGRTDSAAVCSSLTTRRGSMALLRADRYWQVLNGDADDERPPRPPSESRSPDGGRHLRPDRDRAPRDDDRSRPPGRRGRPVGPRSRRSGLHGHELRPPAQAR